MVDEAVVEEPHTFKEMCDIIVAADFLRKKDGTAPTSEEIFNSSPTGELYMIFEWYEIALRITAAQAELTKTLKLMVDDPQESTRQTKECEDA